MLEHGLFCPDVRSLSPVARPLREVPVSLAAVVPRGAENYSQCED